MNILGLILLLGSNNCLRRDAHLYKTASSGIFNIMRMWTLDQGSHEGYDTALVCKNGHVINSSATRMPEFNARFCAQCGSPAISGCEQCKTLIKGSYWGGVIGMEYIPPSYCDNCGGILPWTQIQIDAAKEFLLEASDEMQDAERISESLTQLLSETPQTAVAGLRIRKIISKLGKGLQGQANDLIAKFASEMAVKAIKGEL